MTPSAFLPAQPWVERLGWTLLHFLWQGVLIAKLFAATRALAGRALNPRARYLFACASLGVMALAPAASYLLIGTGSALIPANAPAWSARPFAAADSHFAIGAWNVPVPALAPQMLPWIVTAWLCGALLFSVRLAGGWALTARLRSAVSARPAPPEWQIKVNQLVARMGVSRPVRLLVSSLAQAPVAIGYLRPAILMPLGALAGLPVEQIEALLAHELAHIRRYDYPINLLQSVVEALLFYHPSVWWISNEIRAERELCCDDEAVAVSGDVLTYARALAAVESARPARLQAAVAANGGSLVNRIRRLLDPSQPTPRSESAPGAAAALALLLLAGIAAAAMDRNSVTVQLPPAPNATQLPVTIAPLSQPQPSPPPAVRRVSIHPHRGESRVSPLPEAAETLAQVKEAEHEPARPERGGDEMQARNFLFRNVEVRTWANIDGEPVLDAIEFRGMSDEFANEVRARLPVQEGERISHAAREEMGRTISDYGRRLEFSLFPDNRGGAVLRVHPPGEAGAPLVGKEPKR